ncbi:MAG: replicative DNA helicase, partial [bacterium]|nr:replicative DNA helicase [bacterium]
FIYRPEVYFDAAPKGIAELIVAKQRGGATGTLHLGFKPEFTKFFNLDNIHTEGPF